MNKLLNNKYEVMLETSGSFPIFNIPKEVIKIVDFKCPSSGMVKHNKWSIINDLSINDEVKFIIGNRDDYEWAKSKIKKYHLNEQCTILFSPTFNEIDPGLIVEWILTDSLPVRFQLQIHKYIWKSDRKGV